MRAVLTALLSRSVLSTFFEVVGFLTVAGLVFYVLPFAGIAVLAAELIGLGYLIDPPQRTPKVHRTVTETTTKRVEQR